MRAVKSSLYSITIILPSLAIVYMVATIFTYNNQYLEHEYSRKAYQKMFFCISFFALGASIVRIVSCISSTIYSKSAIMANEIMKTISPCFLITFPNNAAAFGVLVGENLFEVPSTDLFFNIVSTFCISLFVSSGSPSLIRYASSLYFPMILHIIAMITMIILLGILLGALKWIPERLLDKAHIFSTVLFDVLLALILYPTCKLLLPEIVNVEFGSLIITIKLFSVYVCITIGLLTSLVAGLFTEYITSGSNKPVNEIQTACGTGLATGVISGLALGYKSSIYVSLLFALSTYYCFLTGGFYGIILAGLGSSLNVSVSGICHSFFAVSQNAFSMSRLLHLADFASKNLESSLNASKQGLSIIQGIESTDMFFLALSMLGAFLHYNQINTLNILAPLNFCALMIGFMIPFAFAAILLKIVNNIGFKVAKQVKDSIDQLKSEPDLILNYNIIVDLCSKGSLAKSLIFSIGIILFPMFTRLLFGLHCLLSLLLGVLISGFYLSISASISGLSWQSTHILLSKFSLSDKKNNEAINILGLVLKDSLGQPVNSFVKVVMISAFTIAILNN